MIENILRPALAVIPVWTLCFYAYKKDRVEKEPLWLLGILFLFGAVSYIPASLLETFTTKSFYSLFREYMTFFEDGSVAYTDAGARRWHSVLFAFVAVALVEETVKWIVLLCTTGRSKNFNCLFDGILYAIVLSVGFATAENAAIAISDGWRAVLYRSLVLLPSHLVFGAFSGALYTLWNVYRGAQKEEKALVAQQRIGGRKIRLAGWLLTGSLIVPFMLHGVFVLAQTQHQMLFYGMLLILYLGFFFVIRRLSGEDDDNRSVYARILARAHPSLKEQGGEHSDE